MDDNIEQFDWIPEHLTEVLDDMLADSAVRSVVVSGDVTVADSV